MKTLIAMLAITVLIIGLGVAWKVHNYRECRAFGHSFLYCIAQK